MTVKKQLSDEQIEWIQKQKQFADTYLIFGLVIALIAIAAIVCSAVTGAFAQAPACTVWYSAGVVVCDQPPPPTATDTDTPERERQSAGYPAPGDPISEATPTATLGGYPAPSTPGPVYTATPRPTPTLAPDCSIPPNASVWRCEDGTGVPVVTYTPGPTQD